jgi:hypothetical protein
MGEGRHDYDGRRVFMLVRDWTLFVIGCAIIVAEAIAQIGWGHPPDGLIIGTAVALAGGSLVLQKEKG